LAGDMDVGGVMTALLSRPIRGEASF